MQSFGHGIPLSSSMTVKSDDDLIRLSHSCVQSDRFCKMSVASGIAVSLNKIYKCIDDTKIIVNDIAVGKANFLMMAYYLLDLRSFLEELSQEEDFINAIFLEAPLQRLADTVESIYAFTTHCKSSSRILLLYQCNEMVGEITKLFAELVQCLSLMLQGDTEIVPRIEGQIKDMQSNLSRVSFYVEPENENLAKNISEALMNGQADKDFATDLLCKILAHLNLQFFEASALMQELKGDLESARLEGRESNLCLLQGLFTLFTPAVLPAVRNLASEESLAFSADDLAIPSSFYCPITSQIMQDPVMLAEAGYTYERYAIIKWFQEGNNICPNTGTKLESFELVPNLKLKQNMEEFFDLKWQKTLMKTIRQIGPQGNPTELEEAVNTVKHLLDIHPKYKRLLVTLDGIQPLISILKPAEQQLKEKIYSILFSIAVLGDEYKASIIEAGAVPVLLRILQRNPAVNGGPVQLLWELSKSESGRVGILAEKAAVVIVASAFNLCTYDQKLQAEKLLYNLCEHDKSAIIQAATSGLFGPLVRRLASGDEALQLEMLETICSLDLNEQGICSLVDCGVVPPLLNLLQNGKLDCRLKAAKALKLLSNSDKNKVVMAKSGTLPVLVRSLSSRVPDLSLLILETLANLASEKQSAAQIEHEGVVSRLIDMLKFEDVLMHENALRTLDCIAKDSHTVRQWIADLKVVPRLYSLVQNERLYSSCRVNILNLISYLAQDRITRQAIVTPRKMLSFFVGILKGGQGPQGYPYEIEAVLAILSVMAKMDEAKHSMVSETSLLQFSVDCLKSDHLKIKECAAKILARLTDPNLVDTNFQLNLARMGMIPLLVEMLKSGSERSKQYASVTLTHLSMQTPYLTERQSVIKKFLAKLGFSRYKICRVHAGKCSSRGTLCLVESEAVPNLIYLIKDGQHRSAQRAIQALLTLVKNKKDMDRGIDYLVRNDIISSLVHIIGKNENSTEKAVILLERIFKCKKYRVPRYAELAKAALYTTMATGKPDARKAAATALMHLGMVPNTSTYTQTETG